MPILETGMKRAKALNSGFTLVELAVVLVLMGLVAAMVVPTISSRDGDPLAEAEQFAAVLHHASENSILSGSAMGVEITSDQYRILRNRRGQWIALDRDPVFGPRDWSDGLEVAIRREAAEVTPGLPGEPLIVFSATGEVTPFSVQLSRGERSARIDGDHLGSLSIRTADGG